MTNTDTSSGPVDEIPRIPERPRPLRVVRGPDGRPRLVRRGLRALAALQANVPRVLRVGVIRDGRIVEERILRRRETITVGPSERSHFVVADAGLQGRHPLFELREGAGGERYVLTIADGMTGRIGLGGVAAGVMTFEELRASGKGTPGRRGLEVPLDDGCRGKVVVGDTTLLFQFVVPPPVQPLPQLPASVRGGWLARLDGGFAASLGVAMAAHVALLCGTMIPNWPKPTIEELVASDFAPLQLTPMSIEDATPADPKDGDPDEPRPGATNANVKPAGAEPANGGPSGAVGPVEDPKPPADDPQAGRRPGARRPGPDAVALDDEQAAKIGAALDLENLLGGPGGRGAETSFGTAFGGDGASVTQLADAMNHAQSTVDAGTHGTTWSAVADQVVDGPAVGPVGDGTPGAPVPAAHPDRGAVDQTPVGTIDAGPVGAVHAGNPTQAPTANPGEFSAAAFRRALQRKMPAIETCYNHALVGDPTLAGRLAYTIVINQQGGVRVELVSSDAGLDHAGVAACIRQKLGTLNFASTTPRGGDFGVRQEFDFVAP
ncbi:MAG: AgmX/PglI C-terminal domain-containing protein [Deltaproteobacteria bacterium]|nr:AgmX/PglI C-terminal domain-containing protein [Deltaproteobacteria bacterium]